MRANTLVGGRRDVAATASGTNDPDRTPDRLAAGLAFAFIVLLLATELVLTLPDEADSPTYVARFYAEHRGVIIALQLLAVIDALLLGGYAWRLGSVDRFVAGAGLLMAFCALAPTMITLVLAIVADPAHTKTAAELNMLEPRGDDILFVGIVVFASTVAFRLGRNNPALGVLAFIVAGSRSRGPAVICGASRNNGRSEHASQWRACRVADSSAVSCVAAPDDFVDHPKSPSHNA